MNETKNEAGNRQRRLSRQSRTAGCWYLAQAITGPIGIIIVPSMLVAGGDAAATAANLSAHEGLWRFGVLCYLASQLVFIPLALSLRSFLKDAGPALTRLMVSLVVASVPLAVLNLLGYVVPTILIGGQKYLTAFEPAQLQAFALLSVQTTQQGEILIGFFWGLWLLPLGVLVSRSGLFPKVFGIFLLTGCVGYLVDSVAALLFPALRPGLAPLVMFTGILGEIPFLLWLLIRGARYPKLSLPPVAG